MDDLRYQKNSKQINKVNVWRNVSKHCLYEAVMLHSRGYKDGYKHWKATRVSGKRVVGAAVPPVLFRRRVKMLTLD